ncbi:hypothetical protein CVT24_004788 [Panaeolus cyanescens]|uniref:Uncharacterized protein n=1 Tax=Panaeolus cyanescens TaxID=181874 RepID=A0A409WYN0_9AGAR|nr:hypothetical protein CVT24_004788 [Panaeolus cyanescens]
MASQTPESQALLANRNSSVALTAYDGKVGVAMGKYVYTTPNESFIPCPVLGSRTIAVRNDYRYGPDDHTLWPQPYSETFPHLGAIPRRPQDPQNPLSAMWYDPIDTDFVPVHKGGIAKGLGKLSSTLLNNRFAPLVSAVQIRFQAYIAQIPDEKPEKKFVSSIERALHYSYSRLISLPTTWHHIRFTVAEVQRYYLELVGFLDYMEIFKPRMDGLQPPSGSVAQTIGVFTNKTRIVEEFMAAGLPVWYMRPVDSNFGSNVLSVVEPLQYFGVLVTKVHSAFPVLFDAKKYISTGDVVGLIHTFSRKWISAPDPFEDIGDAVAQSDAPKVASQPSSSRSTGPPPRKKFKTTDSMLSRGSSSSSAKPVTQANTSRDKFELLQGPMVPFTIPAWVDALRSVDQSLPPAISQPKRGGYYAFPDPGLFIAPESDKRRQQLIEQYCRIEDAWMHRSSTKSGSSLTNQQWRDLLTVDLTQPVPSLTPAPNETKAAARRREALRLLFTPLDEVNRISHAPNRTSRYYSTNEWFDSGMLPPVENIRLLLFKL